MQSDRWQLWFMNVPYIVLTKNTADLKRPQVKKNKKKERIKDKLADLDIPTDKLYSIQENYFLHSSLKLRATVTFIYSSSFTFFADYSSSFFFLEIFFYFGKY